MERLRPWIPLLLALLTCALAWPTLELGFALDDQAVIQENRFVYTLDIPAILSSAYWDGKALGGPDYYRPLSLISFALEARLGDYDVQVLHAVHILAAGLSSVAVAFLLLTWLPQRPWVAASAALLWATHPLHAEVLANLKSRDALYGVTLGALATALAHRQVQSPTRWRGWLAGLCFLGALLSRESAVVWLALLPLGLWVFTDAAPRRWKDGLRPLGIGLWAWCAFRLQATGSLLPQHPASIDVPDNNLLFAAQSASERWGTTLMLGGWSLSKLFWPLPLLSDYSIGAVPLVGLDDWRAWGSGLLALGLIGLLVLAARRPRGSVGQQLALGLAVGLIAWAPASNTLTLVRGAAMAERYLFLPTLGLGLMLALALDPLRQRGQAGRAGAWALVLGLAGLGTWAQWARFPDWQDSGSLFQADLVKAPGNPRLVNHRLVVLRKAAEADPGAATSLLGQAQDELTATRMLIEQDPERYEQTALKLNDGMTHLCRRAGDLQCALAASQEVKRLASGDPNAWFLAGESAFHLGLYEQALLDFGQAWLLKQQERGVPDTQPTVDYPLNLCVAAYYAGEKGVAVQACREALLVAPDHERAKAALQQAISLE